MTSTYKLSLYWPHAFIFIRDGELGIVLEFKLDIVGMFYIEISWVLFSVQADKYTILKEGNTEPYTRLY